VADADYVVASEAASFIDPHVSYGQVSALEPISLLHRVGLGNALALAVLGSGGRVGAADALRMGLVNEVVAPERLAERALELAERASKASPAAVERTKRAVWAALDLPYSDAMQAGWESIVAHRAHPDALEGPRAFNDKREPNWTSEP
jgi:enoyl-CoA hydratase/carnithine racemase